LSYWLKKSLPTVDKLINTQDRKYQKTKAEVKRFIRKNKNEKIDHSTILNNLNIDYDTLMRILSELKRTGSLKTT
jgi:predicted transcriptional regulator